MDSSKAKRRRNGPIRTDRHPQHRKNKNNDYTVSQNGRRISQQEMMRFTNSSDDTVLLPGNAAIWVTLIVTLVTLVMRLNYVMKETSWWILHPDEIFQSLEVAFSELHGYGYRAYEFLPPAAKDDNLNPYQQRAQQLGMHALRSSLYPRFYTTIGWFAQLTGSTWSPYLIWRTSHVIVSSFLPVAVHIFAVAVFRSRDVGVLVAMLVASSVHLGVLGTHTLVHSFLGPVIFMSLAAAVSVLKLHETAGNSHSNVSGGDRHLQNEREISGKSTTQDSQVLDRKGDCGFASETRIKQSNSSVLSYVYPPSVFFVICRLSGFFRNAFQLVRSSITTDTTVSESAYDTATVDGRGRTIDEKRKSVVNRKNACLDPSTEDRLTQKFGSQRTSSKEPFQENFPQNFDSREDVNFASAKLADCFEAKLTDPFESKSGTNFSSNKTGNSVRQRESVSEHCVGTASLRRIERSSLKLKPALCGFFLFLCCYIRPDTALLLVTFLLPYIPHIINTAFSYHKQFCQHLMWLTFGGVIAILLGVLDDFYCYGFVVVSPYNWFRFNVISNTTSELFGTQSMTMYLDDFILKNYGMYGLLCFNVLAVVLVLGSVAVSKISLGRSMSKPVRKRASFDTQQPEDVSSFRTFNQHLKPQLSEWTVLNLLLSVVILFAVYSLQPHKELRFIHHVMVLYFVFSAASLLYVFTFTQNYAGRFATIVLLFLTIFAFGYNQSCDWPTPQNESFKMWVYAPEVDNHDVAKCVSFIASQNDVRGVFSDKTLVGGFTFLRNNVPLLVLASSGYMEYKMSTRRKLPSSNWFGEKINLSIVTSDDASNYFSTENKRYLVRHLLGHKEYNYLVLGAETEFLQVGYREIFKAGSTKVVKRIGTEEEERRLREIIPYLKLTPESRVLKDDARELFALGLTKLAAERFADAQRLNV